MDKQVKMLVIVLMTFGISCNGITDSSQFDLESIRPVIVKNGEKWDRALKEKNIDILRGLYDDNAHYLVDGNKTFHGVEEITSFWAASFGSFKGLTLNMETIEGTENLLYETGTGTGQFDYGDGNVFEFQFKYVNVWKKQKDQSYKIVIDMFNDIKTP